MRIALAQMNAVVGDLTGNAALIADYAGRAQAAGARLLLTPELALCGYLPEDLLLRPDFSLATAQALDNLAKTLAATVGDMAVVVGHVHRVGDDVFNAASVLRDGQILTTYHKHRLPNHTVFDEVRYFTAGDEACVFLHEGVRFGVNICADIWHPGTAEASAAAGAEVLLVLNASPFHLNKQASRYAVARERVSEAGIPLVYANLVGAQDELVFDGASFVMSAQGEVCQQAVQFDDCLVLVELQHATPRPGEQVALLDDDACIYRALVQGVRDYIGKNGFPGVLLGLSGGIDSALVLTIAVDALGADRVEAVMMPSKFTAGMSVDDSRLMVQALGVKYHEIAIEPLFAAFETALAPEFAGKPADLTEENIQARIRGMLLMALSNKFGKLVLTTSNKSESAVGYATLYGDMAGGFAVLKDVLKTRVYRLAQYRNRCGAVIPERVITRPPSAELRADQTDQDSLPPYDVLDAIIERFVELDESPWEIIQAGYNKSDVERVVRLIALSEYKRRQAAVGVRITPRGFGKDWRYPITSKFRPPCDLPVNGAGGQNHDGA